MTKEYPYNEPLERHFLHIHILDGMLYVAFDDGHWQHTWPDKPLGYGGKADWDAEVRVTLESLQKECCLGPIGEKGDFMFRIPLKAERYHQRSTKFGIPYIETEIL